MQIKIEGLHELNQVFKKLDEVAKCNLLKELAKKSYDKAKENIKPHIKTGKMEHNLYKRVSCKKQSATIGVKPEQTLVEWRGKKISYAVFVHEGTRPHKIKLKKKKSLRWAGALKFIFKDEINHPGYKGDPFVTNAVEDSVKDVYQIFERLTR